MGQRLRAVVHQVCAYFPYPIKGLGQWARWAKRQASVAGIGCTALSNGFASCTDPAALQEICGRLGAGAIGVFSRQLVLGDNVDLVRIDAGYRDGVLHLVIPVAEKAKPRKITLTGTPAATRKSPPASTTGKASRATPSTPQPTPKKREHLIRGAK